MKRHLWVDGLAPMGRGDWGVSALRWHKHSLSRAVVPFERALELPAIDDTASLFERRKTLSKPFNCPDLSRAKPILYPEELLASLHPDLAVSRNHFIYKIGDDDDSFYIPAIVLIHALFTGNRLLNRHLMRPMAPDLLGVAASDATTIYVHGNRGINAAHMNGRNARLLAWLLTKDDARLAHASVLANARKGRLAITPPEVAISAWVRGFEMDVGLFVFQINEELDLRFPLERSTIVFRAGSKLGTFPSYEPPNRSPQSKEYVPGQKSAAVIVTAEKSTQK